MLFQMVPPLCIVWLLTFDIVISTSLLHPWCMVSNVNVLQTGAESWGVKLVPCTDGKIVQIVKDVCARIFLQQCECVPSRRMVYHLPPLPSKGKRFKAFAPFPS
nr:hypothetical protein Iba_chr02bCG9640 [Ipomoea batatas]